jgi:hypothetical protein
MCGTNGDVGTTGFDGDDGGLTPTAFEALTVKVYVSPFTRSLVKLALVVVVSSVGPTSFAVWSREVTV